MAVGQRRSRAALAAGFASWFAARSDSSPTVTVTRPASGLSSETVLLAVEQPQQLSHYVARMPPTGAQLFPDYDLARQAHVQQALAPVVPVAPVVALEQDPSFVGGPFLLMERVPGRTLSNTTEGWPYEAGADEQRRVLDEFLSVLARIHATQPADLGIGELSGGGPSLAGMLDWWDAYLGWASTDTWALEPYRRALDWLRRRVPDVEGNTLLWGDPQLTNCVFADNGTIAAALDWEMTCAGPPEVDLGWLIALQELSFQQFGRPEGFPERNAILGMYAAYSGRPVPEPGEFEWFTVFATLRSGAIVLRAAELMRADGIDTSWTELIPQHRRLAELA